MLKNIKGSLTCGEVTLYEIHKRVVSHTNIIVDLLHGNYAHTYYGIFMEFIVVMIHRKRSNENILGSKQQK